MTRSEAINRWKDIVSTVFWAEDDISKEWHQKLKEATKKSLKEQHAIADAYCEAVAVEIVSRTSDEELSEME